MFAGIWKAIGLIRELVDWIKSLIGFIEEAKHQRAVKDINDAAKQAGDPARTDEERQRAVRDLEDSANRRV